MRLSGPKRGHAPLFYRLQGFLVSVALMPRAYIWNRCDSLAFMLLVGCSDRHFWRIKSRMQELENDAQFPIIFRTLFDYKRRAWVVEFAHKSRLKYDCEPLKWTRTGKDRHVRRQLHEEDLPIKRIYQVPDILHNRKDFRSQQIHSKKALLRYARDPKNTSTLKKIAGVLLKPMAMSQIVATNAFFDAVAPPIPNDKDDPPQAKSVRNSGKLWNRETVPLGAGRVPWSRPHAWNFAFHRLREGFTRDEIVNAWGRGVRSAYVDAQDGVARTPIALATFHATRFAKQKTVIQKTGIQDCVPNANRTPLNPLTPIDYG